MENITEQEMINDGFIDGKKSLDFILDSLQSNFDFAKVHKAMVATEWAWYLGKDQNGRDNYGIPNIQTIKNRALDLVTESYEDGRHRASGGFMTGWDSGELYLTFSLTEFSI